MKAHSKLFSFLTIIFAMIVFSSFALPQVQVETENFSDKSFLINYPVQTMGASTITYSSNFTIAKYDADANVIFSYQKNLSSATGKPHVSTSLWGTFDGVNFDSVAALGAVLDSIETSHEASITYSGIKYPFYRLKNQSNASQATDTQIEVWLYFYKPD